MRKYNKYKCQTHESYVSHDVCIPVEIVEDFKKEYPFIPIKKNLRKILEIYD